MLHEYRAFAAPLSETYATYGYNPNGTKASVYDALGATHTTAYAYDGFDRLGTTTFPDATTEVLTYDADNNILHRTDRSGDLIVYTYDFDDRPYTKTVPTVGSITGYTMTTLYDLVDEQTDVSDTLLNDIAKTYDVLGRIVSETDTIPGLSAKTITTAYDNGLGDKTDRSKITWPDGYYVTYAYDALGHMLTAKENGTTALATYAYDSMARPNTLTYGNGAGTGWTWSPADDLTGLTNTIPSGPGSMGSTFLYNAAHQQVSDTTDTGYVWQPSANATDAYAAVNTLNQYPSWQPQGASSALPLHYDNNANLKSGALDGVSTWFFTYDPENRLMTACTPPVSSTCPSPVVSASYAYDPLGRRTHKSGTGVTETYFLSDGTDEIAEYGSTGTLTNRYVPGPGIDKPIAVVTGTTTYTHSYFHTDKRGSVIAMSDDTGHRSEGPYTYDPYGNCFSGSSPCSTTSGVAYRYTGRRLDPETGLYYYRARCYIPTLGRFCQTDPVGYEADLNLYTYVGNDPTDRTDATGECEPFCGAIIGAIVGGGLEVAQETLVEGKNLSNVSLSRVATQAAVGAVAGATGAGIGALAEKGAAIVASRTAAAVVGETVTGATTGAIQAGANGESVTKGAAFGALGGVVGAKAGQALGNAVDKASAALGQKVDNALAKAGDLGAQLRQTGAMSAGQTRQSTGAVVGGFAKHGAEIVVDAAQKLSQSSCPSGGKSCP